MLRNYIRVIYSNNGALQDISNKLQDAGGGFSERLTTGEDYIYIGQQMPFNNFFAWMTVLNTVSANLTLEYFDGSAWRACVDVLDGTEGFKKSGCIQFVPDKQYEWDYIEDTSEVSDTFELKTLKIYNLYWLRVKSSATLSSGTEWKRLTYAFCMSSDLKTHMPEVDNYLEAWGGEEKTDWIPEIIAASEQMVIDLKGRGLVVHPGQILLFDDVSYGAQMKTLANIMVELGPAFDERRAERMKEYNASLSIKRFTLDVNRNARTEKFEEALTVGVAER